MAGFTVHGAVATLEIYFVRHGHHQEGVRGGWSSHSLSQLGVVQSSLLAERLRREGTTVDSLVSSDLPRAAETAEVLSQVLRVAMSPAEEWREVDNGVLAGMPEEQAQDTYPGLYWSSLEPDQPYPGEESPATFRRRIEGAFRSLCGRPLQGHIGPKIMVVTHGGPIRDTFLLMATPLSFSAIFSRFLFGPLGEPSFVPCSWRFAWNFRGGREGRRQPGVARTRRIHMCLMLAFSRFDANSDLARFEAISELWGQNGGGVTRGS